MSECALGLDRAQSFPASVLIWLDAQLSQFGRQALGAVARGSGALPFFVGISLAGSRLVDPLLKGEEPCPVGAEDLQVVGPLARFKPNLEKWTDEAHHLGDTLKMVAGAQPAL
jgi:hypothetical protein